MITSAPSLTPKGSACSGALPVTPSARSERRSEPDQQPDVRKDMLSRGADPGSGSAAEFGTFVRAEQAKWAKVIKDAGITLEQ